GIAGGWLYRGRAYQGDAEPARTHLCTRPRYHRHRPREPEPRQSGTDVPGQPRGAAADRDVRRPERRRLDPGLRGCRRISLYRRRPEEGTDQADPRPLRLALQRLLEA